MTAKKGFTLIELMIVIGLISILLGFSVSFVAPLRKEMSIKQTLEQVKNDILDTLSYTLAGKSFGAMQSDHGVGTESIPSAYALRFRVDAQDDQVSYDYLELSTQPGAKDLNTSISYQKSKWYPKPSLFLKKIELVDSQENFTQNVQSASILFIPPFGKIVFLDNEDLSLPLLDTDVLFGDSNYDQINLFFQYKGNEDDLIRLSFDNNKMIHY